MDDVPSPARARPAAPASGAAPRGNLPWDGALYAYVRQVEAEREQLKQKVASQQLAISQLHSKLQHARVQLDNWRLRHDAWRRERAELLARLERR